MPLTPLHGSMLDAAQAAGVQTEDPAKPDTESGVAAKELQISYNNMDLLLITWLPHPE